MAFRASPILRIELLHGLLVVVLLALLTPIKAVEPAALVLGALFMGVNFLLMSYGIRWLLAPFVSKRRAALGVALLVVKLALFLGLISALFIRLPLHAPSFAVGISCLLAAIMMERVWLLAREAE
jgi:hypothetical protein